MTIDPSSLPKCILIQITRNPTNLYRKLNPYLVLNIMKIPFTTLLASVAFFLATTEAVEPCVYVGISSSEYNETLNIKTALEYRPTYVSAYANAYGEARYNVIFEKPSATPAWHTNFGYNANDFDKTFEEYKKDGFRPTLVEGYYSGGERHYASIWEKNNENIAWEERRNMSEDEFTSWYNDFVGKGYTLRHLSGYSFNDQEQFAGVFEKKPSPPRKALRLGIDNQANERFAGFEVILSDLADLIDLIEYERRGETSKFMITTGTVYLSWHEALVGIANTTRPAVIFFLPTLRALTTSSPYLGMIND
ncbi:WD40 repeat protein [Microsporum canis CBS 113480]|uniref:WD40 repeat protein n=1 Tax=Arthroderma otae (strain ATCC MYA-4605 / CBS 113480) TaxID=554155 RepID=C5FPC7_ARTOC|nr:WD40 repeat protein [Microsporum canis CBS 113480]EEQ31443.1 WD40 repeat protein [Microsporum canis CBS 113480]